VKVFFDTSVLVATALTGRTSEQILAATVAARWKAFVSEFVMNEFADVVQRSRAVKLRDARKVQRFCKKVDVLRGRCSVTASRAEGRQGFADSSRCPRR